MKVTFKSLFPKNFFTDIIMFVSQIIIVSKNKRLVLTFLKLGVEGTVR